MPQDILTVPTESFDRKTILAHGNEYLTFPEINPKTGGVKNLTALHMRTAGLLEFAGTDGSALLEPYFKAAGSLIHLKKVWTYGHWWIPAFRAKAGQLAVSGQIFAPPGRRGAVYLVKIHNTGEQAELFEVGFKADFGALRHHVFRGRKINGTVTAEYDSWTKSLLLEVESGGPLAALALGLDTEGTWSLHPGPAGQYRASCSMAVVLAPGGEASVPLYLALNIDGSGAGTTVVDLRRHGWRDLLAESETWLEKRCLHMEKLRGTANRNLFFNYFFALGRALDTDEWVAVTSRSPRYYVSAAFWSRDSLLWSFPGIVLADPGAARELLELAYRRHLGRAGEHAHYINGVLLYPGFELDQLSAYVLALKHYIWQTKDEGVLNENWLRRGLPVVLEKLLAVRDEATGLLATFLDPSDDPVRYPFLIYDNVLAQRALEYLAGLMEQGFDLPHDLKGLARELRTAIWEYGVTEGPFGPMFAWAVDGRGNAELYDNPPGSLQLLPYYGFCGYDSKIWRNTVNWIHSAHNPYFKEEGIKGASSRHARNPWPLAAANDLLALNSYGSEFFRKAVMDSGFCCETVHPSTGRAATGHAFATAAGFIAFALWHAFGEKSTEKGGISP